MNKMILTAAISGLLVASIGPFTGAAAGPSGVTQPGLQEQGGAIELAARAGGRGGGARGAHMGGARVGGAHMNRGAHMSRSAGASRSRSASHSTARSANRTGARTGTANRNVNRNANRNVNRNVNRTVNRNVNVNRGAWNRPSGYWWRPGAAVAAGAALGWVSATAAAAYAGAAPGPNMCWYYTDASRTQGFWDACP